MMVFRITHPDYEDDIEEARANPVQNAPLFFIPGIVCDRCGPWASSARLRTVNSEALVAFRGTRFLPKQEWVRHRARWSHELGVDVERLLPGAEIGPPRGELVGEVLQDVVHPAPGQLWVTQPVLSLLTQSGFRGVSVAEVQLIFRPGVPRVRLWEVIPSAVSAPLFRDEGRADVCDACGRVGSAGVGLPDGLVSESLPDVFAVDTNPNVVFVVDRVRKVLEDAGVSNIAFLV